MGEKNTTSPYEASLPLLASFHFCMVPASSHNEQVTSPPFTASFNALLSLITLDVMLYLSESFSAR